MKHFYTLLFLAFFIAGQSQQTVDFEEYNLDSESFLNGSDLSGGFTSQGVFFPNNFNPTYSSWTGFAISNKTDITTPGFTNPYSAIPGSGANESKNFAVSFVNGSSKVIFTDSRILNKMSVTNNTYAGLSMRDGDQFAKKFGGEDGNDPDFFLLTIKGWSEGEMVEDSINFYLADYRFDDNSMDYIVDSWEEVDLTPLNIVDSLQFSLSSSDNSSWGMNTPGYFCLDELLTNIVSSIEDEISIEFELFPNPATQVLTIETDEKLQVQIYNTSGVLMNNTQVIQTTSLNIENYTTGVYYVRVSDGISTTTKRFIKI